MAHDPLVGVTQENKTYGICHDCIPTRFLSEPSKDVAAARKAVRDHIEETEALTGPDAYRQVPSD